VRPKGIGRRICPSCGLTGFPPFSGGWCWYQATLSHNFIFMGVGIPGVGHEFGRDTLAFLCIFYFCLFAHLYVSGFSVFFKVGIKKPFFIGGLRHAVKIHSEGAESPISGRVKRENAWYFGRFNAMFKCQPLFSPF